MDILLTLPPHAAAYVKKHKNEFTGIADVFSDPEGQKLGSGGGTVNVLWRHNLNSEVAKLQNGETKKIVIHSDGESRRLPAYAPMGKSLVPFPVFKWGRGQRINQTLFDVQRPLMEKILERAPEGLNTLVASGDALVWMDIFTEKIPQADVVCVGVWTRPEIASRHGVFVCPRHDPGELYRMLQKPSVETLQGLTGEFLYLLDAGIWLLSDRAVEHLFKASGWDAKKKIFRKGGPEYYDLYSDFGHTLGTLNKEKQPLTVRILPLDQAEFYHFGSNADLLGSTGILHNRIVDQREIWHKKIKPGAEIFVQNSVTKISFQPEHSFLWIENATIPAGWKLHDHHIITGIPVNNWTIDIPAGTCLDFIPVGRHQYCIRPYGYYDMFRGKASNPATQWQNHALTKWFTDRDFSEKEIKPILTGDIYDCLLFPVMDRAAISGPFIQWLISVPEGPGTVHQRYKAEWLKCKRLSSGEIIREANHSRLKGQQRINMEESLTALARNYRQSVFYQLDLKETAATFLKADLSLPPLPATEEPVMMRIHDLMFRSVYYEKKSKEKSEALSKQAFRLLKEGMLDCVRDKKLNPVMNVQRDQIVWGRSPVRFDLAGGWTDTPPYCILYGGQVVNMAVELNGQPPIQVYICPNERPAIRIHSIDLGLDEVIQSYEDISDVTRVGSAFAIPKAALMLAGFHRDYSGNAYKSLRTQLQEFGGGIDISLMVAVPKGSGLGTSSILAATVLGSLSEFCSLGWDRYEIAFRTLLIEQLLTTGGGWQDQFGGIFEGVKLIKSAHGLRQVPAVRWAPEHLFTMPGTNSLILLYYTGITRVARQILSDIVKGMFLNSARHLGILSEMKQHALDTYESIQHHDRAGLSEAIRYSWELNQRLDSGTNTPEISALLNLIRDDMVSCKLLGAGGGGYLMIFARDLVAAQHIRSTLLGHPLNPRARFVDWELSHKGLEVTKS